MKKIQFGAALLLALLLQTVTWGQTQITIYAAASLADVFEALARDFESQNPGVEVLFSFGGSSELAAQLSEGAPADLFASANARQMSVAQEAGRTAGEAAVFARNRLALVVPSDNPAGIGGLADLMQPGVALVVASEGVPVRDYTETMLSALATSDGYGETYVTAFRANIVSEEPNARQVVAKIALGEADAGIVYASDVTPDVRESVIAFEIPEAVNTLAEYPIAVIDDSAEPVLAQAFIDYLLSNSGQATLEEWGFLGVQPDYWCFALGLILPVCLG